jgi:hypothetical protein
MATKSGRNNPARKQNDSGTRAEIREFPGGKVQEGKLQEPKGPYPKQAQKKPGIEAEIEPRPKYAGEAYKPAGKLEDKVALITGGDSGIGRSVAVLYSREGADVAIVYLPQEERDAQETREAVEAEGRRCILIPGDVTEPEFCRQAVEKTVKELGKLDILVNNAAYQQHQGSPEEISDE